MRNCQAEHPVPVPDKCRICWVYTHKEKYRRFYDRRITSSQVRESSQKDQAEKPGVVQRKNRKTPCISLGVVVSRVDPNGIESACQFRWIRKCDKHGQCTLRKTTGDKIPNCSECPDYDPEYDPGDEAHAEDSKQKKAPPQSEENKLSVSEAISLVDTKSAARIQHGWQGWPVMRTAHAEMLKIEMAKPLPPLQAFKSRRGIISCVSARPGWQSGKNLPQGYLPGAWAMVCELRSLGCTLPITFGHIGEAEWDDYLTSLVEPLGVNVIDLRKWEEETGKWRILSGWESKIALAIASGYEQLLFMDADNIPASDPTYLFDSPPFVEHGSLFWPDLPPNNKIRKEWIPPPAWEAVGLDYRNETDFESGQFMIDMGRCQRQVAITKWINEHSDYYYKHVFGDKSTYHLAWRATRADYGMVTKPAKWIHPCIIQHDHRGNPVFFHACRSKPSLSGYPSENVIPAERLMGYIRDLAKQWNGLVWNEPARISSAVDSRLPGKYTYRRVGLDSRMIELLPEGRIGAGSAKREDRWNTVFSGGKTKLVIRGSDQVPTCILEEFDDVWIGKWLEHERCKVEIFRS